MEDNTFYTLSYLAFCLAMILPFGWVIFKASRQPRAPTGKVKRISDANGKDSPR